MYINIVSHHFVRQNLMTVSQWFELGMTAVWKDSKETKQLKQLEQNALEYNQQIQYESGMVSS